MRCTGCRLRSRRGGGRRGCRSSRCRCCGRSFADGLLLRSLRGGGSSSFLTGALSRALGFETLLFSAALGLFLDADLLVDGSLLERLAARVELTRGKIAEARTTSRRGTTRAATRLVLALAGACERPALFALDHDHVLAAMAEALLDVPGRLSALQAQRLAGAGRGGLIRGFLGLTHACSDLALEPGSRVA